MGDEAEKTISANQVTVRLVGAIALFFAFSTTLVGVTVWLTNLSHRADASSTLSKSIQDLSDAQTRASENQARTDGKIDVLLGMQGELAQTRADMDALRARVDGNERWLDKIDVYIDTTRDQLQNQGFDTAPYRSGPKGGDQ
jgi:hypothetical protein